MSLNEIVDPNYKPWLSPSVNSIKIYGDWTYHESEKTAGDNLILDSNLIARWTTPPVNNPYGNAIVVRPASQVISNLNTALTFNYVAPFSPLFSFTTGSNHITITRPGKYIAFANINYNDNQQNTVSVLFQQQSDLNPNTFLPVSGSKVRSFPSTTVFSQLGPYYQTTNISTSGIIITNVPNRQIRIVCSGNISGNEITQQYSSFTIVRISSL